MSYFLKWFWNRGIIIVQYHLIVISYAIKIWWNRLWPIINLSQKQPHFISMRQNILASEMWGLETWGNGKLLFLFLGLRMGGIKWMLVIICTRKVEFPLTDMNIIFRNALAIILQFTWKISQGMKESREHDYKRQIILFFICSK